jgi:hypothetical protein
LADHHREYFDQAEAVAFNKDQRIVIVGQQVTPEIRQTARQRLSGSSGQARNKRGCSSDRAAS